MMPKFKVFEAPNRSQRTRVLFRRSAGGKGWVAEVTVSLATVQSLRSQINAIKSFPVYDSDPKGYELACQALIGRFAPDMAGALEALRSSDLAPAILIVRGLQIDTSPITTPIDGIFCQNEAPVEVAVLIGALRYFGLCGVAYRNENGGQIFRAVCPVRAYSDLASSQGARADLRAHSDNGHFVIAASDDPHPFRFPASNAFQWFATMEPLAGAPMRIKLNDDMIANLDPRGGAAEGLPQFLDLQRSEFRYSSPPSHGVVYRVEPLPALVKLSDPGLGFGLRFHAGTMEGCTPRANVALELLRHAWERTPEEIIETSRGDLIAYDNRRVTHRREPYDARFDGTDRFYVRVYAQREEDVERWQALGGHNRRTY